MVEPPKPLVVSRALTLIALALWFVSLTQPALIIDNGTSKPNIMYGSEVLGLGWLGVGLITAGWYANLPFFAAAAMLLFGVKPPWKTVILGSLLALDTFRLQSLPGGGKADVYGYGAGVTLWLAAFALLFLAVAWRRLELQGRSLSFSALRAPAILLGMAVLAVGITVYGLHAYRARSHASVTEFEFLPPGAVKLGKVCTDVVVAPAARIELNGPLEIRGRAHPLDSPARLLAWGVPVVRKDGFDFALSDAADINSIYARAADGPPAAVLTLSHQLAPRGGAKLDTIEAVLTSADGARTAFRQAWTRDINKGSQYCPDFIQHEFNPALPPQSLLSAALDVPGGLKPASIPVPQNALRVTPFRRETLPRAKIIAAKSDPGVAETPDDAGCAPRAGFLARDTSAASAGGGWRQSFRIDDRRYFLTNNQPLAAACVGDSAYLYYVWLNDDRKSFLLYMQRRQQTGFRKVWTAVVNVEYERAEPFEGKPNVKVRSVAEQDGAVAVELADIGETKAVRLTFVPQAQ